MRNRPLSLVDYIKQFTQESAAKLAPFVISGKLNIEFVKGNQYKYIDKRRKTIEDFADDVKVYKEKKIHNKLLPIYLSRYGILSNNMPIPGFKPQDSSAKRQFDAVKGNDFIKNFMLDIEFKQIYSKAIRHADMYGLTWLKSGIDWSKGDEIANIETTSTNGDKVQKSTYTLKEGRPFIECVPIYEVFIDNLNAESMHEINELVHRRVFSCSYILRRWGIEVPPEKIDDVALASAPKYNDLAFMVADAAEYAYVYEYYKKPDALYPEGRYVLMVGSKIVSDTILPYKNGKRERKIPFDMVTLQNIPNYTVGVTVYSQIIPIQETYNSIKNRYLEYVNQIAIGQLYYWENSLINPKTFSTKPGKLIGLKRNARPPQPVQKDKLSMEFINYLKTLEEDMLTTAGLSQMAVFGSTKSNVRTDGVVDKISESDQNKLVNAVENLSAAMIEVFKKIIYCEKDRINILKEQLQAYGKDDYAIKYKLEHVDPEQVLIVNRDFLIQSDQQIDKKLAQATQLGLYNPQLNLSYLSKLQMLDALQCNYLRDTLDPSEKVTHDLIEDEHYQMTEKNNLPQAEKYHIHKQHVLEHNIFRISPEVRMIKETEPERFKVLMQIIENHIAQHEKYLQGSQQQNTYNNAKALFGGTTSRRGQDRTSTA